MFSGRSVKKPAGSVRMRSQRCGMSAGSPICSIKTAWPSSTLRSVSTMTLSLIHISGELGKSIKWNFTKFLVDRDGQVAVSYTHLDCSWGGRFDLRLFDFENAFG